MTTDRRTFLTIAAAPVLLAGRVGAMASPGPDDSDLPAPKYHLAMNLELMFPAGMPYEDRIAAAAKCGAKHFGFWGHQGKNLDAMLKAQEKHGMACDSISGNPATGWGAGMTLPGKPEADFLADFEAACRVANRFGATNLITFTGAIQKGLAPEAQDAQIIAALKKAGPIAEHYNVYLTLEPLSKLESPGQTMGTTTDAYRYAAGADHPHVKVDFDMYHRQVGEGNVINTLKLGLDKGYVRFIEVGDVPGRKEPGSGEMNYRNIFNFLRRYGYAGSIGMEHGTTRTPQYAWDAVRELAGLG
ncbi:TIM barrel protein [Isosphaeraceae bacterium EP7]